MQVSTRRDQRTGTQPRRSSRYESIRTHLHQVVWNLCDNAMNHGLPIDGIESSSFAMAA